MKKFTTSDGLNLAYNDDGQGTPVLCLPGLTRNGADFDDLAATLKGSVRLIRLTSRGRGQSDYDPNYNNYSIPVEARDAIELLDHLGLGKTVVVGTSRGGLISMLLATTNPERLAGVYLNDIGPVIEETGLAHIMTHLGRNPSFKSYDDAAEQLPVLNAPGFGAVPEGRWRAFAERIWTETPDGLEIRYDPKLRTAVEEASAQPVPDLWPLFDAFGDTPLALVRGVNSKLLSYETAAEMRARNPGMIWKEVPERGHVPFLDEPECVEAFAALMNEVQA